MNQRSKTGCRRRDAEQTQKLKELGFPWDAFSWEERFQQLKEFKEEHGHCKVPWEHPGGLGFWVECQRRHGKEGNQIICNVEQAQKLKELGFKWPSALREARWEERFQQLKAFKEEHGHCKVPWKHPGKLGVWVRTQRSQAGSLCRDASQTRKLEELGLEKLGLRWRTGNFSWDERFQQLKEFKEEYGHCDVPGRHPGGLGGWVKNHRQRGKE